MRQKEVLLIIPAYNEEKNIEKVMKQLAQPEIADIVDVLVMNDASSDNTNWLAKEYGCESVAFPLISSGIYGYPKDQALKVAIDIIGKFLLENEMTVFIVIFDRKAYQISGKLFADITAYIDDRYVKEHSGGTKTAIGAASWRKLFRISSGEDGREAKL